MKNKKDRTFLICQIIVAIVGLVVMIINSRFTFMWAYIVCMLCSIPAIYFNYTLCKFENRWHARWNERNPCGGEPSLFLMYSNKIAEWMIFILALILALLPI